MFDTIIKIMRWVKMGTWRYPYFGLSEIQLITNPDRTMRKKIQLWSDFAESIGMDLRSFHEGIRFDDDRLTLAIEQLIESHLKRR